MKTSAKTEITLSKNYAAGEDPVAEQAVDGTVTVVEIPWHFPANRIDWLFNPTSTNPPFNPEWTWQLNRMFFWNNLSEAYRKTGDEKYAEAFVVQLGDWLEQTGGMPAETGYNDVGSPWRTIEEGLRLLGSWSAAYRAFSVSPAFTTALRERFVASMRAQARHLMAHRTHKNWLLIEMTGVYSFAALFPDFPESGEMRKASARIFSDEIRQQVLPDGMQYELSPDYHYVFFSCAARLYRIAKANGYDRELPEDFLRVIERGAQVVLDMTTPAFIQPRFNDCFSIDAAKILSDAAEFFPNRQDFLWGATRGDNGCAPEGLTASRYLPYAGFAVMRSGWERDATYLAFDIGPLGMGHFHQDKLGFTLWKGDEELVFDDGGGAYEDSDFRRYAVSGYDHNTLLVDGLAQFRTGPHLVEGPIDAGWSSTAERDRVCGVYEDGFGPEQLRLARHEREIVFEKPGLFRITDNVVSLDGQAHDYELLFHVDSTTVSVSADGRSAKVNYGRKWNLQITVREGGVISTDSAVLRPRISGWFIGRNDLVNHPATTISVKAPEKAFRQHFVTEMKITDGEEPRGRNTSRWRQERQAD